ncbi:MAG: SAM-dependent chlorinase/fluorinase [Pirellulales bacterium]|nr:SAM-dependent chlorinase/fluorinase [Pirellulales bacterium]
MSVITLTTDFGTGSPYVAAMKGVILAINPAVTLVDLTHDVPAQDIRQGALVLDQVAERFPEDTVHVAVVDPGVGTDRAIVYARIGRQQYVAPDNGLLSRLASRIAPSMLIRLTNPEYWLAEVSRTFHGRDIMAPVAAHLSLGIDPDRLGLPHRALAELDWPEVRQAGGRIDGTVIEVDSFGNLITNITAEMIGSRPTDERACVVCNIYDTWGIYRTYAEQLRGTLVAVIGSGGRLELAVVGDNAARRLGIQVGTPVVVSWE